MMALFVFALSFGSASGAFAHGCVSSGGGCGGGGKDKGGDSAEHVEGGDKA